MTFEKVLDENIIQLDETTIQAIIGQSAQAKSLITKGISAGVIKNRLTGKPATPEEVAKVAKSSGLTDSALIAKIQSLVKQRNGGSGGLDKAVADFKTKSAQAANYQKQFGRA